MSYAAEQAAIPKLEHRPGTPIEIVRSCREAVIPVAQAHARERGAELVRVDATSAGQTRRARNGQIAPVEVGVVYSAPGGRATRAGRDRVSGRPSGPRLYCGSCNRNTLGKLCA